MQSAGAELQVKSRLLSREVVLSVVCFRGWTCLGFFGRGGGASFGRRIGGQARIEVRHEQVSLPPVSANASYGDCGLDEAARDVVYSTVRVRRDNFCRR